MKKLWIIAAVLLSAMVSCKSGGKSSDDAISSLNPLIFELDVPFDTHTFHYVQEENGKVESVGVSSFKAQTKMGKTTVMDTPVGKAKYSYDQLGLIEGYMLFSNASGSLVPIDAYIFDFNEDGTKLIVTKLFKVEDKWGDDQWIEGICCEVNLENLGDGKWKRTQLFYDPNNESKKDTLPRTEIITIGKKTAKREAVGSKVVHEYKLDKAGRITELVLSGEKNGEEQSVMVKRSYDSKGLMVKYDIGDPNDGGTARTFEYSDFDDHGNWTKKHIYEDGELKAMEEKEIVYADEKKEK